MVRDWAKWIWQLANDLSTVVFVIGLAIAIYLFFSGMLPVLWRLGNLRRRKIAIFAKGDASRSLVSLFVDARLFNPKNIIPITSVADFGRSDAATVYVAHWPDWQDDLQDIVERKSDQTPLVVYAPHGDPPLPAGALMLLDRHRNVVLTNFRGRLLTDVVSSFITTAYEKR